MRIGRKGKIRTNVIVGYVVLVLCSISIGLVGLIRINLVNEGNMQIQDKAITPIVEFLDISLILQKISLNSLVVSTEEDFEIAKKAHEKALQYAGQIDFLVEEIKTNHLDNENENNFIIFEETMKDIVETEREIYYLRNQGLEDKAVDTYNNKMVNFISEEEENIKSIADDKTAIISDFLIENINKAELTATMMLVFIVISLIVCVFLTLLSIEELGRLNKMVQLAKRVATGDLNVEVPKSESDNEIGELADSFRILVSNSNRVLTSVIKASDQVEAGASQVSDSSMSLSQGTSEQASAIEELSASLHNISQTIKENINSSVFASELSRSAKQEVDNGSEYMLDLVEAMKSIDESSKNISKVIKVIDDIAFQTNILALNAAVEAARAGQYGRGFAVVADEVRNLAAKSASAVEETTVMIETSLEKIKIGSSKAELTAKAFNEILTTVNKLNDYGQRVVVTSENQAKDIEQINQGISQIADVVQSTSATAEETAAASEELSEQSIILRRELSIFKLKNYKSYKQNRYRDNEHKEIIIAQERNWNTINSNDISDSQNSVESINLSDSEFGKY